MAANEKKMNAEEGLEEHLFKILVVGDIGTGKTSIIKRYVHGIFSANYKSTIGVDFALKVLEQPKEKRTLRLQLWDIAGQERFGNMTRVYYREAAGGIVVYDRTREATLEGAIRWKRDIDEKLGDNTPVMLFANKSDACETPVDKDLLDQLCKKSGFIGWIETSAKSGSGIGDGIDLVLQNVAVLKKPEPPKSEFVRLDTDETDGANGGGGKRTGCC
jgi:small GTP-binding protein